MTLCVACGWPVSDVVALVHRHHEEDCIGMDYCLCPHGGPCCSAECCAYPGCRPIEVPGQGALL
jgi:hypothetical protein